MAGLLGVISVTVNFVMLGKFMVVVRERLGLEALASVVTSYTRWSLVKPISWPLPEVAVSAAMKMGATLAVHI